MSVEDGAISSVASLRGQQHLEAGIVPHDQRLAFLCQTRLLEYALDIRKQNLPDLVQGAVVLPQLTVVQGRQGEHVALVVLLVEGADRVAGGHDVLDDALQELGVHLLRGLGRGPALLVAHQNRVLLGCRFGSCRRLLCCNWGGGHRDPRRGGDVDLLHGPGVDDLQAHAGLAHRRLGEVSAAGGLVLLDGLHPRWLRGGPRGTARVSLELGSGHL
mmetsp:Transcript_41575/g.70137  ORF Transcript_41575/g.70137 Transcript_41575/m.70137 type:complete len:216 (+) Transcript_41575:192-839(+)